jgi:hypothetical protein
MALATANRPNRIWWLAVLFLSAAVAIDVVDGEPLKLLTSTSLLLGCILAATLPVPRSRLAGVAIALCFFAGAAVLFYRVVGPGL